MFAHKVRLSPLVYRFVNLTLQTNMVPKIYRDLSALGYPNGTSSEINIGNEFETGQNFT